MGALGTVAAVVFALSFVTFVALFGRLPALRYSTSFYEYLFITTLNSTKLCLFLEKLQLVCCIVSSGSIPPSFCAWSMVSFLAPGSHDGEAVLDII